MTAGPFPHNERARRRPPDTRGAPAGGNGGAVTVDPVTVSPKSKGPPAAHRHPGGTGGGWGVRARLYWPGVTPRSHLLSGCACDENPLGGRLCLLLCLSLSVHPCLCRYIGCVTTRDTNRQTSKHRPDSPTRHHYLPPRPSTSPLNTQRSTPMVI